MRAFCQLNNIKPCRRPGEVAQHKQNFRIHFQAWTTRDDSIRWVGGRQSKLFYLLMSRASDEPKLILNKFFLPLSSSARLSSGRRREWGGWKRQRKVFNVIKIHLRSLRDEKRKSRSGIDLMYRRIERDERRWKGREEGRLIGCESCCGLDGWLRSRIET